MFYLIFSDSPLAPTQITATMPSSSNTSATLITAVTLALKYDIFFLVVAIISCALATFSTSSHF